MTKKNFFILIISILIPEMVGFIGSLFTTPSISTWYVDLAKPSFVPPTWIFAPVWTTLFFLMGIAAYIVLSSQTDERVSRKYALIMYGVQLILNVLWSILFFGLHSPFAAFIEIIALWLAILVTTFEFAKVSWVAGVLLLPYIGWVSYATYLTFMIWQLN